MNKIIIAAIALTSTTLAGCATSVPVGGLYTNLSLPVTATEGATSSKRGEASCQSILGLIAQGDCSIDAAKKNGGIRKVSHVDWDANNILGIIGNYKVTVHGE